MFNNLAKKKKKKSSKPKEGEEEATADGDVDLSALKKKKKKSKPKVGTLHIVGSIRMLTLCRQIQTTLRPSSLRLLERRTRMVMPQLSPNPSKRVIC